MAVEFILFEIRGETDETISFLDEMKNVSIQAEERYFQLSKLEVSIAQAQPTASNAMINLLTQAIEQNQMRTPAWQRSIQEEKLEWQL